jgi:hypothetical protein
MHAQTTHRRSQMWVLMVLMDVMEKCAIVLDLQHTVACVAVGPELQWLHVSSFRICTRISGFACAELRHTHTHTHTHMSHALNQTFCADNTMVLQLSIRWSWIVYCIVRLRRQYPNFMLVPHTQGSWATRTTVDCRETRACMKTAGRHVRA